MIWTVAALVFGAALLVVLVAGAGVTFAMALRLLAGVRG
jgi:hypothetical protein